MSASTPTRNQVAEMSVEPLPIPTETEVKSSSSTTEEEEKCDNPFGVYGNDGDVPSKNNHVCKDGFSPNKPGKGKPGKEDSPDSDDGAREKLDLPEGYKVTFYVDYKTREKKWGEIVAFKKANKTYLRISMNKNHHIYAFPTEGRQVPVVPLALGNKYLCEVIVNTRDNIISGSCKNLTNKNK